LLPFSTVTVSFDRTLPHEHATVDDEAAGTERPDDRDATEMPARRAYIAYMGEPLAKLLGLAAWRSPQCSW